MLHFEFPKRINGDKKELVEFITHKFLQSDSETKGHWHKGYLIARDKRLKSGTYNTNNAYDFTEHYHVQL